MRHVFECLVYAANVAHFPLPQHIFTVRAHKIHARAEREDARHILRAAFKVLRHFPRLVQLQRARTRAALYQAFQLFAVFRNEHTRAHRTV